jgi:hypothetical protein
LQYTNKKSKEGQKNSKNTVEFPNILVDLVNLVTSHGTGCGLEDLDPLTDRILRPKDPDSVGFGFVPNTTPESTVILLRRFSKGESLSLHFGWVAACVCLKCRQFYCSVGYIPKF